MNKLITLSAILVITGCAGTSQTMAPVNTPGLASTTASQIPSLSSSTGELASGALSTTTPLASATGQLPVTSAASGLAGSALGSSSTAAQTPGLVDLLVQKLGVTPQQATGGAGSIFSVAQQSLGANKFSAVSSAVPGMSSLLAAAPAMGGGASSGMLGSAAGALGGGGTSALGMAALASSFQSLGLGGGMVSQFIPVILQYVQAQGGTSTMGLLQGALMP